MKYESELIKEIVDSRGHKQSSLHYESECIETWIEEVKGAYPKLCDYQSEWLDYISALDDTGGGEDPKPPIGEFPYETVTTNHTAMVDHVVPLAYKSAILKGQTTDTNIEFTESVKIQNANKNFNFLVPPKLNKKYILALELTDVTPNHGESDYIAVRGVKEDGSYDELARVTQSYTNGIYEIPCEFAKNYSNLRIAVSFKATIVNMKLRGDLISVRMPVLTTTGKNLFDGKLENGFLSDSTGQPTSSTNHKYTPTFIKIDATKKYCFHAEADTFIGVVNAYYYDVYKNYLGVGKDIIIGVNTNISKLFTPHYKNASYIRFRLFKPTDVELPLDPKNIGFYESSTTINTYEPYNSNILTVNEDVTLRSNGDICDELNLLTGQLTQRIGEDGVVLSQEVIKTLDLTIVNQAGEPLSKFKPLEGTMHIEVSGTPINPTAVLEVPVEAITQNLYSFIGEE